LIYRMIRPFGRTSGLTEFNIIEMNELSPSNRIYLTDYVNVL
jgi:hypothetical protein